MSDLHHRGVLDRSLWSYNTSLTEDDSLEDNPIRLDCVPGIERIMRDFLNCGPYVCDSHDSAAHNDHRQINTNLYTQSYCHLVLETLFDVDQSGGAFLTEKTFKCLKYGQPFVIAGPPNSIAELRRMGYRVFDNVIDHGYDSVTNNTERWFKLKESIKQIQTADSKDWIKQCRNDITHNQEVFATTNRKLVDELSKQLYQLAAA